MIDLDYQPTWDNPSFPGLAVRDWTDRKWTACGNISADRSIFQGEFFFSNLTKEMGQNAQKWKRQRKTGAVKERVKDRDEPECEGNGEGWGLTRV